MDRQGVSHEPVVNPRATQCAGGTQRKNPPNSHDSNARAFQSQRRRRVDSTQGQSPGGNQGGGQGGDPPNNPNHQSTAPLYAQRRGYCCTWCDRCKDHFSINGRLAFCSNNNPALEVRVGEPGHPCLGPSLRAPSTSSGQCTNSCLFCDNCAHFHRRCVGQEYVWTPCRHGRYAVFVPADHLEHSRVCPGLNQTGSAPLAIQYAQNYLEPQSASSGSPPRRPDYPSHRRTPSSPEAQSPSSLDQHGWTSFGNRSSSACSQQQQQQQQQRPQRSPTMPQLGEEYVGSSFLQH